jgi:eukaryotic-like serine/threonine-protein kinase
MSTPSLRQLFESLVDLDADARARHLQELQLDAELSQALIALLDGDARQLPLLAISASEAAEFWQDKCQLAERYIGRQIGPFRIMSVLGQGGTSFVFRAERAAGDAKQTVALKLLFGGLLSPDAQRRFGREQAILAQLSHPNIARLIEGGISDIGVPYIAMELVEGEPITLHAGAHTLSLRARIALMVTLCQAIEAAHGALVVHRDLKPSNVYVDGDGAVKVLDFGIAKVLGDDSAQAPTQAIMLTPEYAAPEQFKPGPVTTSSDVYALGVLLGELLTGRLLGAASTTRASAIAGSTGGDQVSRGLPGRDLLVRQLRGDLDAIIGTALAEEPARRYRSAGAMADDLERYLNGQPVRAHPPSRWYRARKFVQRHRGGVAMSALLVLGILTSLMIALWQADAARRAAIVAKAEAARANAMREFMFDAFAEAEPSTPNATDATVVDVVERAIMTAQADRQTDPRARIDLLIRLAQVLNARGNPERAATLLELAQQQASRELRAEDSLLWALEQALIYNLVELGKLDEARQRGEQLLRALPADQVGARIDLLTELAVIAAGQGDFDRGIQTATTAVELARKLNDAELLHNALRSLGSNLRQADRGAEAIPILEECLRLQRERFGDAHVRVAGAEDALSRAYRWKGDLVRAEQHARAALAIDARVLPKDHPSQSTHLNALVTVLNQRRAYAEALQPLKEIIRVQRSGEGDPNNLAANLGTLGSVYASLNDLPLALEANKEALAVVAGGSGIHSELGIRIRLNLGYLQALNGARALGEREIDRAVAELRAKDIPNQEVIGTALERKMTLALDAGDFAAAQMQMAPYLEVAHALRARPNWPGRGETRRAELLLGLGQTESALTALETAAQEFHSEVQVDPVIDTTQAMLQVLAAQQQGDPAQIAARRQIAQQKFRFLTYPPRGVRNLAARVLGDDYSLK